MNDKNHPIVLFNKGTKYLKQGNPHKALAYYKRALKLGDYKEAYLNIGNTYRLLRNLKDAKKSYKLAADTTVQYFDGSFGEYPQALCNLGLLTYAEGDDEGAIELYLRALEKDPMLFDAIWNYASAMLRQYYSGKDVDVSVAWRMYEYRFKRSSPTIIDRSFPLWDRHSTGKDICVLAEQGFGDKIMFGRYLPLLAKLFDNVYIQAHKSIACFYSDYTVIEHSSECPPGTVGIPLCSLASVFQLMEPVSSNWLDGKFIAKEYDDKNFNIGVVWSGSTTHSNDYYRSCSVDYMRSLSKYGTLYSLNPDAPDCARIISCGKPTWAETCSAVLGLDLVVTVDTSIVHLAGTLGVPCIMVQPLQETDFRWGLGRRDTVWYPSVTVVENNNNWDECFSKVRKIIDDKDY